MTSQPVASRHPARSTHRRRIRAAAAIAGVAALLTTGGYVAIITIGSDAATPATPVNPSAGTMRDMVESIVGQYGSRSAPRAEASPSAQSLRELRQAIVGQYGSQSERESAVAANARVMRELRHSIEGQYGAAWRE
jgi:hypothetical protein